MSRPRNRQPRIGIAIYRPEDWARLRETAADRVDLEATWEEWSCGIARLEGQLRSAGTPYEAVLVDPDELAQYCQQKGLRNDASARASYVSHLLRRDHRNGHGDNPDR